MTDGPIHELSPSGRARREAMLADLTETLRRTHRARRRRRRTLAAAALALGALAVIRLSLIGVPAPDRARTIADLPTPPSAPPQPDSVVPTCVIVRVETDPTILERVRAAPIGRVVLLDDPALIATLAQVRRPAGLIRDADGVRFSAPVTDAERAIKRRG